MKKTFSLILTSCMMLGFLANATAMAVDPINAPGREKANEVTGERRNDTPTSSDEVEEKVKKAKPEYNPRSDKARENMSEVAKAVEELIRSAERMEDPGIGEQVRVIAQAQGESEDKTNQAIDEAEDRGGFAKFFIGANFGALNKIKQEMVQNENRIRELERLKNQLQDEAEQQEIQEQIRLLQEKNQQLSNYLEEETSGFSLFGWLFRWINGY